MTSRSVHISLGVEETFYICNVSSNISNVVSLKEKRCVCTLQQAFLGGLGRANGLLGINQPMIGDEIQYQLTTYIEP